MFDYSDLGAATMNDKQRIALRKEFERILGEYVALEKKHGPATMLTFNAELRQALMLSKAVEDEMAPRIEQWARAYKCSVHALKAALYEFYLHHRQTPRGAPH